MDQPNPEFRNATVERHDSAPVLTPDESRQAIMTGRNRWILAISVSLAVIAMIVLYAIYF